MNRLDPIYEAREAYLSVTETKQFDKPVSDLVKSFVEHAQEFLCLEKVPKISFLEKRREGMTHGMFCPQTEEVCVYVRGRAVADFLRSLAHELVHYKQSIDKKIPEGDIQEVGGPLEDEANSVGGQIVKSFGKKRSSVYDL